MIKTLYGKVGKEKSNGEDEKTHAFSIFKSVKQLPEKWDSITDNFFLKTSYLTALEENSPANMDFRYAVIKHSGKVSGIAYFQIVELNGDSLNTEAPKGEPDYCPIGLKKNLKKLLKRSAEKVSFNVLICGNSFISGEHGFDFKGISAMEAYTQLDLIAEEINRQEKSTKKISVTLIKDFYKEGTSSELSRHRYHNFNVEPNMILPVDKGWKTFEDYLEAMSSKYRKRTKSIIRKGGKITSRNFETKDIEKYSKEIDTLYYAVHMKAKFRLASLNAEYYCSLKRSVPENFTFTGYFLDKVLVAFRTSFILEDKLEAHFIGLDYDLNKTHDLYQNILYDYVKEGLKNKVKEIYFGRTASEIKSTVGAKGVDLVCYVKHRNSISNSIIKPFIEFLQPSPWVPRNPFNKEVVEKREKAEV